jgi:mono/diheme cytochrome c family protein
MCKGSRTCHGPFSLEFMRQRTESPTGLVHMFRWWKWPEALTLASGAALFGAVTWWQWPTPPVLDVTHVSNVEFHQELQQVGFDRPAASADAQPLVWNRPVHDEAAVADLVRSLDLSPGTLAAGPHVDFVSTQTSIHFREPVLDSILAWSNAATDVWILRQRYLAGRGSWLTFGLVQDKTVAPNVAFFLSIAPGSLMFHGSACFLCHASGPRFLRPMRPDLLVGASLAAAYNERITSNGYVRTHFPAADPEPATGPALAASACVSCHQVGGDRGPIYRIHGESIRALIATGAMPRDGHLSTAQVAEIDAWLSAKRD